MPEELRAELLRDLQEIYEKHKESGDIDWFDPYEIAYMAEELRDGEPYREDCTHEQIVQVIEAWRDKNLGR